MANHTAKLHHYDSLEEFLSGYLHYTQHIFFHAETDHCFVTFIQFQK